MVRKLIVGLFFLSNILVVTAQDNALITVCRDRTVEWLRFTFAYVGAAPLDYWGYIQNGGGGNGDEHHFTMDANSDNTAEFFVVINGQYYTVYGDENTPDCGNNPQPGDAPSIPIVLSSDCSFIDIQDDFGHWSRVESDGEPVLLHYGESLIAGRSQSLDSADYRAVPTDCPA